MQTPQQAIVAFVLDWAVLARLVGRSPSETSVPQAYLNKKLPAWDITASVLLIVGGCLVAGIGDFSFDLRG